MGYVMVLTDRTDDGEENHDKDGDNDDDTRYIRMITAFMVQHDWRIKTCEDYIISQDTDQ